MTLELPLIAVKLTLGREKQPQASTLTLDSKDFAIFCLGIALLFTTLAVVSLTAQRQAVELLTLPTRRGGLGLTGRLLFASKSDSR
jgi:hypothetical protein